MAEGKTQKIIRLNLILQINEDKPAHFTLYNAHLPY